MPRIQTLTDIEAPVLLFGGVYSNLEALQALQALAEERGIPPHQILCTGDIVGYCADPEECVQAVRRWGVHSIAGNVEIQLRNGESDCGCDFNADSRCDFFAKQWYPYAQQRISPESIAWMHTLPEFIRFELGGKRCFVLHGSYFKTSEFIFRSTPWPVKERNFEATGAEVIIAGHCGLPFHHLQGERWWLNPGVIGMPANDGTTRVWCMLLDVVAGQLTFRHLPFEFDHEETFARMLETELPIAYAKTLTSGLWDNNDILPPEETAQQGIPLELASFSLP